MSSGVDVRITGLADGGVSSLRSIIFGRRGFAVIYLTRKTRKVARLARMKAPKRTGMLAASIRSDITWKAGIPIGRVSVNVPYAEFVTGGTQPHIIRPNSKRALSFTTSRGRVVTPIVYHPGNRGNSFLLKALAQEMLT
jgi:hypothetical protein